MTTSRFAHASSVFLLLPSMAAPGHGTLPRRVTVNLIMLQFLLLITAYCQNPSMTGNAYEPLGAVVRQGAMCALIPFPLTKHC